ncbi:hypothetical protein ACFX1T_032704 [Malus domestica]
MRASIKIYTRRSFRNRRGACSEIEKAFAFSKAGLLRDHEGRSQKSKRRLLSQKLGCSKTTKVDLRNQRGACVLKSWAAQRPRGPISEIEEAPAFSALSALVTCTLSFAKITGILSKISGETSKHAQPLLTFEKTLLTRLLALRSKSHRLPNLESQTPNMITFSKIEETSLSESWEPNSQQDCFLKNRRGTILRISRARPPT